jgi:DNA-binding Xre family transcriptional regulator
MPRKRDKKYFSKQITARFILAMDHIISDRQNGKVTATAFGAIVGISGSNLTRLRDSNGENTVTTEAIGRLCDHYKISAYWLITGKGSMDENDELTSSLKKIKTVFPDIEQAVKTISIALKSEIKNKKP